MMVEMPTRWRQGTPMPTKRSELAVARVDRRFYVAGGYGGLNAFESYDPDTGSWEQHADLPVGLNHPSLGAVDGLVYLTGGSQNRMWAYDPQSDSWEARAAMPQSRYAAAAVGLAGALYIVGGSGVNATDILRYDPSSDSWSTRGQLDQVRDHLCATVLNGKIYILGGRRGATVRTTAIYDPMTEDLRAGPPMMDSRAGFGAAAIGRFICAAGGEVLGFPSVTRQTAECWDTSNDSWTFVDDLPRPLHGVGAAALEGRMYLFGGATAAGTIDGSEGWLTILEP